MHTHHKAEGVETSNRISAWLSIACAIHCALMPLLLSALPLVGLEFLASHALEAIVLALGLGFGAYGVLKAYFYKHRTALPVGLLAAGAVLVLCGLFIAAEPIEHFLVPSGAVMVGAAQVVNIRLVKACNHCA